MRGINLLKSLTQWFLLNLSSAIFKNELKINEISIRFLFLKTPGNPRRKKGHERQRKENGKRPWLTSKNSDFETILSTKLKIKFLE